MRQHFYWVFIFVAALSVCASQAQAATAPEVYQQGKDIQVLIVPGHDQDFSGTVFNGIREADVNLALAQKIKEELSIDPQIHVTVARDEHGYIDPLKRYFETRENKVERFIKKRKNATNNLIEQGTIEPQEQIPHNDAPKLAAYRLYAINMWADEREFDLIIHIHFNDDGTRKKNKAGEYDGFSVYIPEVGLLNAKVTKPLGQALGMRLNQVVYPSNLPHEQEKADEYGVVEDFNLIALGSNRTLKLPSVLIEYAYIYEPHVAPQFFVDTATVMGRATAAGVLQYLRGIIQPEQAARYQWDTNLAFSKNKKLDVLMLQFALRENGVYPPEGFTRDQCGFDGVYGVCTQAAVKAFQKKNHLATDGKVGPSMRSVLNAFYSEIKAE